MPLRISCLDNADLNKTLNRSRRREMNLENFNSSRVVWDGLPRLNASVGIRRSTGIFKDWRSCSLKYVRSSISFQSPAPCRFSTSTDLMPRRDANQKSSNKIGRAHSELQSPLNLVCRLLLEKKKI